jgi:hypothetical protein
MALLMCIAVKMPRIIPPLVLFPRLLRWAMLAIVTCSLARVAPAADAKTPTVHEIKAAFLLNFPKYVEWPASAFGEKTSAIVLTILGDRKVEGELRRMAAGKSFNGRGFEVRAAGSPAEVSMDTHIVFIGAAERRHTLEVISRLGASHVLTVGDNENFTASGGMINLARNERRIQLEINLVPADAASLKISSKLLRVADVIKRGEK